MDSYLIVSKAVYKEDFTFAKNREKEYRWTALQKCRLGDLAFFYVGAPYQEIVAVGTVASEPELEEGPFDWTEREYEVFCEFDRIRSLKPPIRFRDGGRGSVLRSWYKGSPYRNSRRIQGEVADALVDQIIESNPHLAAWFSKLGFNRQSASLEEQSLALPPLTPECVFTIRNLDDLGSAFRNGGSGEFVENKAWASAAKALTTAKLTGTRMPIFFSDSASVGELHYWAFLTSISVRGRTTTYGFERLRRFSKKPRQSALRIASSGEAVPRGHIRPYVICVTPGAKSPLYQQMCIAEVSVTDAAQPQFDIAALVDERERIKRAIAVRRGQPEFRQRLLAAYNGMCAVTGCDAADALEAAHILPYSGEQSNHVANGLLLRADLHTLFDLDLIGIEPHTLKVSLVPDLRRSAYAEIHGKNLAAPSDPANRPSNDALAERWAKFASQ